MQVRNVNFDDRLDSDEEMEITTQSNGAETYAWLDIDAAIYVIQHLKSVFDLDDVCIVCMHKECLCDNGPTFI